MILISFHLVKEKKDDATKIPAVFYELDWKDKEQKISYTLEEQLEFVDKLISIGFSVPNIQLFTGSKSIHNYYFLREEDQDNILDWTYVQKLIIFFTGSDDSICKPNQLMRLAGVRSKNGNISRYRINHENKNKIQDLINILESNLESYQHIKDEVYEIKKPVVLDTSHYTQDDYFRAENIFNQICSKKSFGEGCGNYTFACECAHAAYIEGVSRSSIEATLLANGVSKKRVNDLGRAAEKGKWDSIHQGALYAIAKDLGIDISNPDYRPIKNTEKNKMKTITDDDKFIKEQVKEKFKRLEFAKKLIQHNIELEDQPALLKKKMSCSPAEALSAVYEANQIKMMPKLKISPRKFKIDRERFLVPNILVKGMNLIIATPGTGKSRFVMKAIDHCLNGTGFLGHHKPEEVCDGMRVLIVGPDQSIDEWGDILLDMRLATIVGGTEQEPEIELDHRVDFLPIATFGNEFYRYISKWSRDNKHGIIVIDSFAGMRFISSIGENDTEAALPIYAIRNNIPSGYPVFTIHHANKIRDTKDSDASRGSSAIPAAVDRVIHLQRYKEGDSTCPLRILSSTKRGGADCKMFYDMGNWLPVDIKKHENNIDEESIDEEQPTVKLNTKVSKLQEAKDCIISHLEDNPLLRYTNLRDDMIDNGLTESTIRRAIKSLEDEGEIIKDRDKKYSIVS